MIQLGDHVRDTISGFEGIVTQRKDGLYTATEFGVEAQTCKDNGDLFQREWFPAAQLELVEAKRARGFIAVHGKRGSGNDNAVITREE